MFCQKAVMKKVWKIYRKSPAVETFVANICFDKTPADGCFYVEEVIMSANLQEICFDGIGINFCEFVKN